MLMNVQGRGYRQRRGRSTSVSLRINARNFASLCRRAASRSYQHQPVLRSATPPVQARDRTGFPAQDTQPLLAHHQRSLDSGDQGWNRIRILGGHTAAVQSVTFSPDGHLLLSGSADGTTRLWNVADGREVRRFVSHQGPLGAFGSVAFLPDGMRVLTAGADGAIRCWHIDHRAAMDALRHRLLRELTAKERLQYGPGGG
ncbi:MAG: hypothetical protein J7455_16500 [Roseiflexus sp.]|jgi:WD40 repeat protein|nr:hypothetical protein [Roseiflexus sp.]MBO9342430.1 hypothetical protein [Roseiflexus sp.]MBO9364139.1 hypothetical protein [Roseiflexus sp.]MBO9382246.1 hypothetical protein [Roseiflexus sp.]MBO9390600.1 hypothetical protein [Roseiflexus sp.]